MKGWIILLAAALLPRLCTGISFSKIPGIDDVRVRRVVLSPESPSVMAVASVNTLYISTDGGERFHKAAVLVDEQIRQIFIDNPVGPVVYVAGTRHCYRVGETTERIFSALDEEEIHDIHRHQGYLYIATSKGLYYSNESPRSWKILPGLKGAQVFSAEGFGRSVYLATDGGVYRFRPDGMLQRLLVVRGDEEDSLRPRLVRADPMTPARLWLGTNRGLFCSRDRGETWNRFYINGAGAAPVNCMAQPLLESNILYLCTDAGFFKVNTDDGRAEALYDGLATTRINWMDFSASGGIYLATARGLYSSGPTPDRAETELSDILAGEPTIQQVQEAAIHYNSVNPERIEHWRRRLKYRALMPRVSFDYDRTIGYSVSSSGKYFGTGPYDWGVTLSWDMGNLVWNSYEDDVDNRSRLTTLLRMDILDEINRLYYERLRIKRELMAAKQPSDDTAMKELRLYELTATLDGYTGGFFSKELAN